MTDISTVNEQRQRLGLVNAAAQSSISSLLSTRSVAPIHRADDRLV